MPKYKQQSLVYNQQFASASPAYSQPTRYNAPVNYQQAAASPRFQPEYQPQYRSHYQGQQLRSAYPSPAIPAGPQGHAATNINMNADLASYTVNYK
ncbi:hypothetical protein EAI_11789 [Harpegnathos saltator]|uniref:Uncharacterized protein n=2 Tax=Harpegnathos saltator TaxID=610380 RepID=E2B5M7_HARSA|nr:hypothetical protein EAI_11789 [Harpegnathos saltator]